MKFYKRQMRFSAYWITGAILSSLLLTCAPAAEVPTPQVENPVVDTRMVVTDKDPITLQWDAAPASVASYKLHYRVHDTTDWVFLADVPAATAPEYSIRHSVLGNGKFDFAVTAVDYWDRTSDFHSSLDQTAQPAGGWYVMWQK